MKKLLPVILAAVMLMSLTACSDMEIGKPIEADPAAPAPTYTAQSDYIQLNGDSASYSGSGVTVKGSTVTISGPGEYTFKGSLDGQIVVNIGEIPGKVTLILDGVTLRNDSQPCIFAEQGKTVVALADGSVNSVTSGNANAMAAASDTATGGAIYGKDDLSVQGSGELTVIGAVNNGIASKNDLKINCGKLSVTAANNGLKGNDSVTVDGGEITVSCFNDGIKATSLDRADKGFVTINGGSVSVTSAGDGISAATGFTLNDGSVSVVSGTSGSLVSCKAVKAATKLEICGGTLNAEAYDHAVHCDADVNISGGTLNIVSHSAKGISAHGNVNISDGTVTVSAQSDGIEAKENMNVSGGEVSVTAAGDGFNVGSAGNSYGFYSGDYTCTVSGGRVYINSGEDGIDSNGNLAVLGGELIIDGPTSGMDGALDYASEIGKTGYINGGTVLAVGAPNMAEGFDANSTQSFLFANLNSTAPAGSTLTVADAGGSVIYTATCAKECGNVVFSCADITAGETYTVTVGGLSVQTVAGENAGMGGPGGMMPPNGMGGPGAPGEVPPPRP